jgi:hypothetical protein
MSDNDPSTADPFGLIADEFVEALRQGKCPTVEESARRYPEQANEIRDLLPAVRSRIIASLQDCTCSRQPTLHRIACIAVQSCNDATALPPRTTCPMGLLSPRRVSRRTCSRECREASRGSGDE